MKHKFAAYVLLAFLIAYIAQNPTGAAHTGKSETLRRISDALMVRRPSIDLGLSLTPVASVVAAAVAGEDPALIGPLMESLDCPDASQLTPARAESTTALQALSMMNNALIRYA